MSAAVPRTDKRLAAVCRRLRDLADEIESKARHGLMYLFVQEHIIQAHSGWRLEVQVPELEDYERNPLGSESIPLPLGVDEAALMLRRVVEECKGVRGITSPCAPNPELLQDILELLKRAPDL